MDLGREAERRAAAAVSLLRSSGDLMSGSGRVRAGPRIYRESRETCERRGWTRYPPGAALLDLSRSHYAARLRSALIAGEFESKVRSACAAVVSYTAGMKRVHRAPVQSRGCIMNAMTETAVSTENRYGSDAERWDAVRSRDRAADGLFFFSVRTTGVYCRSSSLLGSRDRDFVPFHSYLSPRLGSAGFRPCLRSPVPMSYHFAQRQAAGDRGSVPLHRPSAGRSSAWITSPTARA